jgi:hypothetical protein
MLALDDSTLNVLETKGNLKNKQNAEGVQRVLSFLQQQISKESTDEFDPASALRSKRQIIENRRNEIIEGLQLEKNRIEMASEDGQRQFYYFMENKVESTFLMNISLQKNEMNLVHAKNKWLLRANDFAKQILEDIAVYPPSDDQLNIEINSLVFACQSLSKKILQKSFISLNDLNSLQFISSLPKEQLSNSLLVYHYFELFIIYFEKQAIPLLLMVSAEKENDFGGGSPIRGGKNLANEEKENPLSRSNQLQVIDVLLNYFFLFFENSMNSISVDDIISLSSLHQSSSSSRENKEDIQYQLTETFTNLSLLLPTSFQALVALLQFLLDLVSKISAGLTNIINPEDFTLSSSQFIIIDMILLIWKYCSSSIVSSLMKWINLCNEFSFGENDLFTKLSKVLIGSNSFRGNLLLVSHLYYHCSLSMNSLSSYLLQQQKQHKTKLKQQQSLAKMKESNTLKEIVTKPSRKTFYTSGPASSSQQPSSSENESKKTSFLLDEKKKEDYHNMNNNPFYHSKYLLSSFFTSHFESLLQVSLDLAENIIQQNGIRLGHLGHPLAMTIGDSFYFKVYDFEVIVCIDIVSDFYSQDLLSVAGNENVENHFHKNAFFFDDGIDSCLIILKELSILSHHRLSSIFLNFHILKVFLSGINFYLSYSHLFSFDSREYSIYQKGGNGGEGTGAGGGGGILARKQQKKALQKRKENVKALKKELIKHSSNPLQEFSSSASQSSSILDGRKNKRNAFASELGQFAYRVLGIMNLHYTSLNICHKSLLYLRLVMREAFLEKHLIEDLFSLPLHTIVDPWLVTISLGLDDEDEEEEVAKEGDGDDEGEGYLSGINESKSQFSSSIISGNDSLAEESASLISRQSHINNETKSKTSGKKGVTIVSTPSVVVEHNKKFGAGGVGGDDGRSISSETTASSVTTKTADLTPPQYLLRMKKTFIPKAFKGEIDKNALKQQKQKNKKPSSSSVSASNLQESMTLIDIIIFISENHIQSNEVIEQMLLIIYQIAMKSNLIKYLFIENNLPIPIQRFSDAQHSKQTYLIALSELCLEALTIKT